MSSELQLGRLVEGSQAYRLPADRLRTHGVVVGMTGSGKTGLCVVLLEELARAGVPVIAIDPKGDLGNLGLLFPSLSADEFAPWVEQGTDPAQTAARWREGLAGWGLDAGDVAALRQRLDLTVYTPGSDAGVPVDVLGAFRRPSGAAADDADARLGLVTGTVSGLLELVGRGGDPVRDPAHIVLSQILDLAWGAGEDPDLETLILRLVDPPFAKVGIFPVDRFFPPDDRMKLAMDLNGLAAAPTFAPWTRGVALDVEAMLRTPGDGGRTPVHVFSLAHLTDSQRQFFLSLLLGRVQAWTRVQGGTSRLRALLYFDEVAGHIPPHPKNPPTKEPLLAMMKQARAVGLGIVLATQNPVDVDYKALSNAGLWCVGRLQTHQDRDRLIKGLGRPDLDDVVEGLQKRSFLIHDSRAEQPAVIRSRWAMSYLRGPLTRVEIGRMKELGGGGAPTPVTPSAAESVQTQAPPPGPASVAPPPVAPVAAATPAADDGLLPAPPPAPSDTWYLDPRTVFSVRLGELFEGHAEPHREDDALHYRPALYADLELRFDEDRVGFLLDHREHRLWFPLGDRLPADAERIPVEDGDLRTEPEPAGRFEPLPTWMDEPDELAELKRRITDDVYRTETRGMFVHKELKLYGRGGEPRPQFEARCHHAIVDRLHDKIAKLKDRYETQAERIEKKIRDAERKASELEGALRSRKTEEAVNIGEAVFSLFSGRKRSMSTVVSKHRQTSTAEARLERTEETIADLRFEAVELYERLSEEIKELERREERLMDDIEERPVRLERNDIRVLAFGVVWVPVSRRV